MTDKNIQIRDLSGNNLFPKTKGSLVYNNSNQNLGSVEAGAQVNVLEAITLNGSTAGISVSGKTADITLPAAIAYTITKLSTATSGYLASYQLCADGVGIAGSVIDIPKDYLVKSASMKICEEAGVPATTPALAVGDPYLDFVINTKDSSVSDSHIYINVKGLVDIYTEGTNIDITNNTISVDLTGYAKAASAAAISGSDSLNVALGKLEYKADEAVVKNAAISAGTKCKITYDAKGLVTGGADLSAADIPNLASSKINALTGYTKGTSAAAIDTSDNLNVALGKLEFKADAAVVANAAITGATKCKITYDNKGLVTAGADLSAADIPNLAVSKINAMTGYSKAASFAAIAESDSLSVAIGKLEKGLDTKQDTITGGATSIVSSNLTASKVLVSDANGKVAVSDVSTTQLGNLITYVELSE